MNQFQWNLNRNSNIFIQENAFEDVVCEMAAIFFRGRWVKLVPKQARISTLSIQLFPKYKSNRRSAASKHNICKATKKRDVMLE